jgi:hypothetical protein
MTARTIKTLNFKQERVNIVLTEVSLLLYFMAAVLYIL